MLATQFPFVLSLSKHPSDHKLSFDKLRTNGAW